MAPWPKMPVEPEVPNPSTFKKPGYNDATPSNLILSLPPFARLPISSPPLPVVGLSNPNPPQNNTPVNRAFYKTQICTSFNLGSCTYGDSCNFAHGTDDLRRPPANWQEIAVAKGKNQAAGGRGYKTNGLKMCWKFFSGEVCLYGDKCIYLHDRPRVLRESSAVRRGTTEMPAAAGINGGPECNGFARSFGYTNGHYQKPVFGSTKPCNNGVMTGSCHRLPEVKRLRDNTEVEATKPELEATKPVITGPGDDDHLPSKTSIKQQQKMEPLGPIKRRKIKKINGIYGDWID